MLCSCCKRLLGALVLVLSTTAATAALPFDPGVPSIPSEVRLPRWERAADALVREGRALDACLEALENCESDRLAAWRELVLTFADTPPRVRLQAVDSFVDATPYRGDQAQYGSRDYWAGPIEFLLGAGDCEDYAIAKYATLRRMGFAARDLQIVVLEDRARGLAHAVLAVRVDDEVWLLDNQEPAPVPAASAVHYAPYYAVNETRRWLHRLPDAAATGR